MSWSATAFPADSTGSSPAPLPRQDPGLAQRPAQQAADDETLAAMYVRMWTLATGRTLQPGVKPDQLTADELIEFWDDVAPVSGRHAAPEFDSAGEV